MEIKISDYLKKTFTVPERATPVKIWCFYKEPYKMGLAATILTAIAIILTLLFIMLIGGGAFLILCGLGIVIFLGYWGILIAFGGSGALGFSLGERFGLLTTVLTIWLAWLLHKSIYDPVKQFLFGDFGWESRDTGIFDYGMWSFEQLSSPLMWALNFVQINWLSLIIVILTPAAVVFSIAGLLFIGMYGLQAIEKLVQSYYGIRFPCPVCGQKSEPAHYHCPSCGKKHEVNLVPSVYGVFNHVCTNQDCNESLSTMMLLGRNKKIRRTCPHHDCQTPLNDVTGTDKHVALIGGRNAGKTCLLAQVTKFMVDNYNAELPEQEQRRHYEQLVRLINKGEVPQQTQRITNFRAFQLVYKKRLFPYHLHLYDIAGENFEHVFDSASYPFYKNLDAIIFLFDPYSIRTFREQNPPPKNMVYSSQEPFDVLQNLIQALEKYNSKSQVKKIKLNVVLVKTDTGYLDNLKINLEKKEKEHQALERFVQDYIGDKAFVAQANSVFKRTKYFQLSALGRTPDPGDRSPFVAKNIQDSIQEIYKSIGVTI